MPLLDETLFARPELRRVADRLRALARPGVHLQTRLTTDDQIALGATKIGGWPDLPPELNWPIVRHRQRVREHGAKSLADSWLEADIALAFVAQVRCSDLAPYDIEYRLPPEGRLFFFYSVGEDEDIDFKDEAGNTHVTYLWPYYLTALRVLWWPDETTPLVRTAPPVPAPGLGNREPPVWAPCAVTPKKIWTLPKVETCWIGEPDGPAVVSLTRDEWLAYADHLWGQQLGRHLMLSHSDNAQPYALERYWHYRAELFPELPPVEGDGFHSDAFLPESTANRLLLQLDVDENDMRFGSGPLLVAIRDIDLAARDFSKVWYCVQ